MCVIKKCRNIATRFNSARSMRPAKTMLTMSEEVKADKIEKDKNDN